MVIEQTKNAVSNLKERPKGDKKVVAGSIAIAVVVLLFLGWALLFFQRVQSDRESSVANRTGDKPLPESVRDVQQSSAENTTYLSDLERMRVGIDPFYRSQQ